MRFDGFIFDIEGTLIDCIPQNLRSWQETLASFGVTVSLDVLQPYSGMDGDDMLRILAPDMDKKVRKKALEAEGKNFEARYLKSVRAFAGIRPLFEAIKRGGGKIAFATDCQDPQLKHYRAVLGVDDLIDAIACGEDVGEGKPKPQTRQPGSPALGHHPNSGSDDRGHAVRCQGRAGRGCLRLGRFDRRVLFGGSQERRLLCGDKRGWRDETISGNIGKNSGR